MRTRTLVLLALLIATPLTAQERRPMTTDDALDMVRVGGVLMSTDGSWVLFSKSELDWDENERKTTWWRAPADGSEDPYRFIGEEGGSAFQFSPDGAWLSFKRPVDEKDQLFVMRTNGGEALRLSDHKTAIGAYAWSGDASTILFVATDDRGEEEEKARKDGDDAIFVDEGPSGQTAGQWTNLWRLDVDSKEETQITSEEHRIGSFSLSPDGHRVLFTSRRENRRNQGDLSEIHLIDLESGETRQLTDNHAPERRLTWSPDGRRFLYQAPSDSEWELRLEKLWVMDVESGRSDMVSGAFEGSIRTVAWTPDASAILFGGL